MAWGYLKLNYGIGWERFNGYLYLYFFEKSLRIDLMSPEARWLKNKHFEWWERKTNFMYKGW